MTEKNLQIRNSTVDFLVLTKHNSEDSIEVRVQDEAADRLIYKKKFCRKCLISIIRLCNHI